MNRYQVACPGCAKVMRSADKVDLRGVLMRHIRNCVPVRSMAAKSTQSRQKRNRVVSAVLATLFLVGAAAWLGWRG